MRAGRGGRVKDSVIDALKRAAEFSGIELEAYAEGGRYLEICRRYVYLNPVRAGIVKHASDYAWSRIAAPDEPFEGTVPEERLLRRVAQIGGGKIFGSEVFVVSMAFSLGDRFRSRSIAARAVEGLGYATHGWRLARAEAKAEGAA